MQRHFTVVIPTYNSEKWTRRNFASALKQEYDNFDIVFINDSSTDTTGQVAEETHKELKQTTNANVKIIHNDKNKKALHNIYSAVENSKLGTIIVTLDGDDWLADESVLNYLNGVYNDNSIWMTAGSYVENYGGTIKRPDIDDDFWSSNVRTKLWTISHLRTFRRDLFMKIKKEDMLDKDGEFYKFTFDQVMMYPMIEMAWKEHFKPIDKILYVYNRSNPLSVDRIHRHDQLRIEHEVKNKKPYDRIDSL